MEQELRGKIFTSTFISWQESLRPLLELAGLERRLAGAGLILIKPNLVEALAPPVTTPVALVAALLDFLRSVTAARIVIGEGSGAINYDTGHSFAELGYTELARRQGVELIDLNEEKSVRFRKKECRRWPEMFLPEIACDCFLISVPVLKAHTLAGVTLTMKNMMGLAPPSHYRHGKSWQKSAFHARIQEGIADLNRYRTPDFTLLDATIGLAEAHLRGPACSPPVNLLAAGYDPVAIDAYGAGLLGRRWQDIGHIRMVHNELGLAEPLTIVSTNGAGTRP